MLRFKIFSVILILSGGALLLAISTPTLAATSDARAGSFVSEGTGTFNPWTAIEYCGVAKKNADAKAAATCAPGAAVRISDFDQQFLAVGHGMQCKASAEYICQ